MRSGIPTFSAAVSIGTSPKAWKMNATRSRRSASRSGSDIRVTSRPSTQTRPAVGWSRPPMMFSSVVLPEPDRPRSATSWPRSTVNETPRSAGTAVCPLPKVRQTPSAATMTEFIALHMLARPHAELTRYGNGFPAPADYVPCHEKTAPREDRLRIRRHDRHRARHPRPRPGQHHQLRPGCLALLGKHAKPVQVRIRRHRKHPRGLFCPLPRGCPRPLIFDLPAGSSTLTEVSGPVLAPPEEFSYRGQLYTIMSVNPGADSFTVFLDGRLFVNAGPAITRALGFMVCQPRTVR
jgi:hypothetical protein